MSASSRVAQGKAISEDSWTALAKDKERDWWSIDFGGEVGELEVGGPWTLPKATPWTTRGDVSPARRQNTAVEEEESMGRSMNDVMEIEMELDAEVPQTESAEMKSPRRNVIRGESEEPQDYVSETLSISPEEAEELTFVPSAITEPRGVKYFGDNRCSENATRY